MKFCRIDLSKTDYKTLPFSHLVSNTEKDDIMDRLQELYYTYCTYKQFESVVPLFKGLILDKHIDVIGYYPQGKLVAFSLVKRYDSENAESLQFVWNYEQPDLRLGIESLKHECAYYKNKGYKYLYLGLADEYKSCIDGYELLGPL
jgi:hypothetical protein